MDGHADTDPAGGDGAASSGSQGDFSQTSPFVTRRGVPSQAKIKAVSNGN
jgi:hypothetical protein